MNSKKYYAVKNGRKIGVFKTWDECNTQVKGFKGAEFKSFKTLEEAKKYLDGEKIESILLENIKEDEIIAYVDGSYNIDTENFGYGVVILDVNGEHHFNGSDNNEEYKVHRNVAGEVYGSMEAIKYAIKNNKKTIFLHFDYMGIKSWALGEWKTNKELTQRYKKFIDSIKDKIEVKFIKVKAHSNDKYNDIADRLAKDAVGVK